MLREILQTFLVLLFLATVGGGLATVVAHAAGREIKSAAARSGNGAGPSDTQE